MLTQGTAVTPAVDVYAFGVLMWEVFSRRRAWAGEQRFARGAHSRCTALCGAARRARAECAQNTATTAAIVHTIH